MNGQHAEKMGGQVWDWKWLWLRGKLSSLLRSTLDALGLSFVALSLLSLFAGGVEIIVSGVSITCHRVTQPLLLAMATVLVKSCVFDDFRVALESAAKRSILYRRGVRVLFGFLSGCILFFMGMSLAYYGDEAWNLDIEASHGTAFSGLLYLGLALAALFTGRCEGETRVARHRAWYGVSGIFFYLAWDEMARLHETFRMLVDPIVREMGPGGAWYMDHFGWQGVFGPFLAVAGAYLIIVFHEKLRHEPGAFKRIGVAMGAYALAIGLDALLVISPEIWGFRKWEIALEEGLEMFASVLILAAIVGYVRGLLSGEHHPNAG